MALRRSKLLATGFPLYTKWSRLFNVQVAKLYEQNNLTPLDRDFTVDEYKLLEALGFGNSDFQSEKCRTLLSLMSQAEEQFLKQKDEAPPAANRPAVIHELRVQAGTYLLALMASKRLPNESERDHIDRYYNFLVDISFGVSAHLMDPEAKIYLINNFYKQINKKQLTGVQADKLKELLELYTKQAKEQKKDWGVKPKRDVYSARVKVEGYSPMGGNSVFSSDDDDDEDEISDEDNSNKKRKKQNKNSRSISSPMQGSQSDGDIPLDVLEHHKRVWRAAFMGQVVAKASTVDGVVDAIRGLGVYTMGNSVVAAQDHPLIDPHMGQEDIQQVRQDIVAILKQPSLPSPKKSKSSEQQADTDWTVTVNGHVYGATKREKDAGAQWFKEGSWSFFEKMASYSLMSDAGFDIQYRFGRVFPLIGSSDAVMDFDETERTEIERTLRKELAEEGIWLARIMLRILAIRETPADQRETKYRELIAWLASLGYSDAESHVSNFDPLTKELIWNELNKLINDKVIIPSKEATVMGYAQVQLMLEVDPSVLKHAHDELAESQACCFNYATKSMQKAINQLPKDDVRKLLAQNVLNEAKSIKSELDPITDLPQVTDCLQRATTFVRQQETVLNETHFPRDHGKMDLNLAGLQQSINNLSSIKATDKFQSKLKIFAGALMFTAGLALTIAACITPGAAGFAIPGALMMMGGVGCMVYGYKRLKDKPAVLKKDHGLLQSSQMFFNQLHHRVYNGQHPEERFDENANSRIENADKNNNSSLTEKDADGSTTQRRGRLRRTGTGSGDGEELELQSFAENRGASSSSSAASSTSNHRQTGSGYRWNQGGPQSWKEWNAEEKAKASAKKLDRYSRRNW